MDNDTSRDRLGKGLESLIPTSSPFDAIRRISEVGAEFWSARDLMPLLGYEKWERFAGAIERAGVTATNQGAETAISRIREMVAQGGAERIDYRLSRFGAYLVAMNGDPRKPEVAAAQAYFAIRTREAETATPAIEVPKTMGDALRLAADEYDRAERAEAQVRELAPKADLADDYLLSQGGARLVREVAKTLGRKEKDLRRWLIDEKLIFVKHAPCGAIQYDFYAQYALHFQAREKVVEHQWGNCTHYTLLILPRGVELIHHRLRGGSPS